MHSIWPFNDDSENGQVKPQKPELHGQNRNIKVYRHGYDRVLANS